MKIQLERLAKDIEERIRVQRCLIIQFDELGDIETVGKLRILNSAYSLFLTSIKIILKS